MIALPPFGVHTDHQDRDTTELPRTGNIREALVSSFHGDAIVFGHSGDPGNERADAVWSLQ